MRKLSIIMAVAMALTVMTASVALADRDGPTCANLQFQLDDIANHAQHIIGDYVTGDGHDGEWPPNGLVGNRGEPGVPGSGAAVAPGAAAPNGHFGAGLAPGASFCTGRAEFNTPGPFAP